MPFTVNATVINDCTIAATNINFGTAGILSSTLTATGTLSVACTNNDAYSIALSPGAGSGATVADRRMTKAGGTDQMGDFAKIHLRGNLFVHQAGHHESDYLSLPRCQRAVAGPKRRDGLLGRAARRIARQRIRDCVQHVLIAKGLGKKVERSRFHGLDGHFHVAMACHEQNRHLQAALRHFFLKGEAAFAAQPDVENQATGRVVLLEGEQLVRRSERLDA
ncbi:hypothetical protein OKW35_000315 [Paraburkholderia sp. MM5477-R1]